MDFIAAIKSALAAKPRKCFCPCSRAMCPKTFADIDDLVRESRLQAIDAAERWRRPVSSPGIGPTTGKLARDFKYRAAWPGPSVPHGPDRPAKRASDIGRACRICTAAHDPDQKPGRSLRDLNGLVRGGDKR